MASTYNGSVANLVDPLSNSPLNSPSHSGQHTEINDALQALGTWTSYTPTIKGGATTVTATINYAKYVQFNKTVFVEVDATITSAGAANGTITVSLPSGLTPVSQNDTRVVGTFVIKDTGTAYYAGLAIVSGGVVQGIAYNTGNYMGAMTPAMTLANTDQVGMSIVYEVA